MDPLLTDILDQPRALRTALQASHGSPALAEAVALCRQARRVLLSGMGASFFSAYPAFLRMLSAGAAVTWIEAGELLHHAPSALVKDTVVVLVSQSGRSAEVLRLLETSGEARVIGVTNDPDSPLARGADVYLPLSAGPELAGVATKTFACSLLLLDLLSGGAAEGWPGRIAGLEHTLASREQWLPGLTDALRITEHLWVLGRGPLVAAASVAGLMLKEAGGLHGEGCSVPQFRHGPLEMAGPGRSALLFVSPGELGPWDLELAGEMAAAGMAVVAVCAEGAPKDAAPGVHVLHWPWCPAEVACLIVPAQCLAHACALRRGVVPGTFARIGKVTTRE